MYAILRDPGIQPVAECTADDLAQWLAGAGRPVVLVDLAGLRTLDIHAVRVLLVPYRTGEFGRALDSLLAFHARGGALFFLGDLPHRGCWYPLRNIAAPELHLTRCNDDLRVRGFSSQARALLGELPEPAPVLNKGVSALRISAYPPDVAHALLESEPGTDWPARAVVLVERKCEPFFGARLGIIGFTGGEPRENACGVYAREWTYDPGLLTRAWEGLPVLVLRMADWLATRTVEGGIGCGRVARSGEADRLRVQARNHAAGPADGHLRLLHNGAEVWASPRLRLAHAESLAQDIPVANLFGLETWELQWVAADAPAGAAPRVLHTLLRRILPAGAAAAAGMGFSTYQAFQDGVVTGAFRHFVRELRAGGMQYMRCNIPWEDVEPEPGRYDWRVPDQLLALAAEAGLELQFWCFPTTRGSGLSDAGVPLWVLREAAVDRDGRKGFFPSLGSPYYNTHYFAMLEAFVARYADSPALKRLVFDYGNSDFPYGYFYYGSDPSLFDYSEWERRAFAAYLQDELRLSPAAIGALFHASALTPEAIPVPKPEQADAWRAYLGYRTFAIGRGVDRAAAIVARRAPEKVAADHPGHGLGSISDISTYLYETKARHWQEEAAAPAALTRMHNAGPTWGGEAWQVGGSFAQMDDALFNSIRVNASYFSVGGADLGVDADELARLAFIRRTLQGATRPEPRIAILDRLAWHQRDSLCQVGLRLDQPVALLCAQHRFDFRCFDLLVLPPVNASLSTTEGGRSGGYLVPTDRDWHQRLRRAVEQGSRVLVFPETFALLPDECRREIASVFPEILEPVFACPELREVVCPASFGSGRIRGRSSRVELAGRVLLQDARGDACLVERALGAGAILAAGWGAAPEGPDEVLLPEVARSCATHTLARLLNHLGMMPERVDSGHAFLHKELLDIRGGNVLLLFSEWRDTQLLELELRLRTPAGRALDLSTGESYEVTASQRPDWHHLSIPVRRRQGRYLVFSQGNPLASQASNSSSKAGYGKVCGCD